ncbi:MAG TPA: glycosyltransferase family 4 protein [Verrucomicrobiae bacterium]|nr:glycosyltransferase family 4 protein [Verrucomicrobiae bacterium]
MTPTKQKILMVGYLPPPYFGPSTTYTALLRSEFPQRFDVTFLDITVAKSVGDIEKFRVGKLFKMCRFLLRELWLLTTHRFDFACALVSVNRNAFIKDAALLGLARAFGVPTVLYAHGNNIPDFHDRSSPWMQRLIARTCRKAAGAIVLGECLRFNFERWLPQDRIFVVPTGFVPMDVVPKPSKQPGVVTVVYLGLMFRDKGVFVLLEAAAKIAAKRRDIRFVFMGAWFRAEEEAVARQFVADHQLDQQVAFLGRVSNEVKWQTLVNADMLVFPTFYYYETMGAVLPEAMQAGLPVIATRRASIPEIVEEPKYGLLINEQDADDLKEKILRLADDPVLRAKMGAAGRQRFDSYYTHEHYGRRMIGVFEQLSVRHP